MEATKQRKWALKFVYPFGDHQYAGQRWRDNEYSGVGHDLTKAVLFDSQQEALQDMMRTYRRAVLDGTSFFPVPVPVFIETKTETAAYEEDSNNAS